MTRAEISNALRQAWMAALMDEHDFREDMADSYSAWIKGIVSAAAPELSGQGAAQGGQQGQQGGEGGGQPQGGQAPAEGGMQ